MEEQNIPVGETDETVSQNTPDGGVNTGDSSQDSAEMSSGSESSEDTPLTPEQLSEEYEKLKSENLTLQENIKGKAGWIAANRDKVKDYDSRSTANSVRSDPHTQNLNSTVLEAMESASPSEKAQYLEQYGREFARQQAVHNSQTELQNSANVIDAQGSQLYDDWGKVMQGAVFGMSEQDQAIFVKDLIGLKDPKTIYEVASQTVNERNPVYKYLKSKETPPQQKTVKKVANAPQTTLKSTSNSTGNPTSYEERKIRYMERHGLV